MLAARASFGRPTHPTDSFVGIDLWSGMNFQLYTAMGHAAQAMVGLVLIATPLVPKWVAGFTIAFSLVDFLSQMPGTSRIPRLRGLFIPILMHVAPALIGIGLMVRQCRTAPTLRSHPAQTNSFSNVARQLEADA